MSNTQPITARELRTGNLIQVLKDMNESTVTNIYGLSGLVDAKETESGMLHPRLSLVIGCNAIVLTPEWLERFGFEKDDLGVFGIQNGWLTLKCEDEDWNDISIDVFLRGMYLTCVQHVHQLQNLYFALTGQELTPNK